MPAVVRGSRALLMLVTVLGSTLGVVDSVTAQPAPGDELLVEVAAARHMLARAAGHGLRSPDVTLSPLFADSISAPGAPRLARRDSARTVALAVALGGRVALAGDSTVVHLLLSEPTVRGDSATVTVTMMWFDARRGRGLRGYETVALTLAREGGTWRVLRERQLGIS